VNKQKITTFFLVICGTALLLALAGCFNEPISAPSEGKDSNAVAYEPTPEPTHVLTGIPAIQGITEGQVLRIDRFDDSVPPDTPAITYAATNEIEKQLSRLKSIRLAEYLEAPRSEAPGGWSRYDILCFDGTKISISFSMDTVNFGQGYYTYTENTATFGQDFFTYIDSQAVKDDRKVWLAIEQEQYVKGTETIHYTFFNHTGHTVAVVLAPQLERATEEGWVPIKCEGLFCGTTDRVDDASHQDLRLADWFPTAEEGIHRLSLTLYEKDNKVSVISDIFILKARREVCLFKTISF
jgi:hypothetical protein